MIETWARAANMAANRSRDYFVEALHDRREGMSDIVERLRDWPRMTPVGCKEAADEIERLRATIADLTAVLSAADAAINPPGRGGISLATWNERLKSATEKIRAALTGSRGGTT